MILFVFPSSASSRRISLVDVNRASVSIFRRLPDVSPQLAEEIVRYRESVGFFDDMSDILNVPGMTEELYEEISQYLVITSPELLRSDEVIQDLEVMEEEEEDYFEEMDIDLNRLERYRANPLDLNSAALSQLMDLPLVTREIAESIINKRKELRGFTHPRDIRELAGEEVYEMISPFITVLDEVDLERFHGDSRIEARIVYPFADGYFDEDPVYHHPLQLYLRQRVYYGNRFELGVIIRRRAQAHYHDTDASREFNYTNIIEHYLGNRYLLMRNISFFDTVVLGSYRLDYFRQATRSRQLRGLRQDDRTFFNSGFYGAAAEVRRNNWELTGFLSDKTIPVNKINADGSVGMRPTRFYDSINYPIYDPPGFLKEEAYGTIFRFSPGCDVTLGAGAYTQRFDKTIDDEDYDITRFRGDRIDIYDLEAEYRYQNLSFIADLGLSKYHTFDREEGEDPVEENRRWYWDEGRALRLTAVSEHTNASFWGSYWKVDHDYFEFLGEGHGSYYPGRNSEIHEIGGQAEVRKNLSLRFDFQRREALRFIDDSAAVKRQWNMNWRHGWEPLDVLWIRYRGALRISNKREGIADEGVYLDERTSRHTLEIIHRASDDLRLRWVYRTETAIYDEIGYLRELDTTDGNYGEIRYRPVSNLLFTGRISPDSDGLAFMLRPVITLSRDAMLRMEYEYDPRDPASATTAGNSSTTYSVQYTMSW